MNFHVRMALYKLNSYHQSNVILYCNNLTSQACIDHNLLVFYFTNVGNFEMNLSFPHITSVHKKYVHNTKLLSQKIDLHNFFTRDFFRKSIFLVKMSSVKNNNIFFLPCFTET